MQYFETGEPQWLKDTAGVRLEGHGNSYGRLAEEVFVFHEKYEHGVFEYANHRWVSNRQIKKMAEHNDTIISCSQMWQYRVFGKCCNMPIELLQEFSTYLGERHAECEPDKQITDAVAASIITMLAIGIELTIQTWVKYHADNFNGAGTSQSLQFEARESPRFQPWNESSNKIKVHKKFTFLF